MDEQKMLGILAEELQGNEESRAAFQKSPKAFLTTFLAKHTESGELSDDALEGVAGGGFKSFDLNRFASRVAESSSFGKEFVSRINSKADVMW